MEVVEPVSEVNSELEQSGMGVSQYQKLQDALRLMQPVRHVDPVVSQDRMFQEIKQKDLCSLKNLKALNSYMKI